MVTVQAKEWSLRWSLILGQQKIVDMDKLKCLNILIYFDKNLSIFKEVMSKIFKRAQVYHT